MTKFSAESGSRNALRSREISQILQIVNYNLGLPVVAQESLGVCKCQSVTVRTPVRACSRACGSESTDSDSSSGVVPVTDSL